MEEATLSPKKKVTFGKAYVRVLLNYNEENDSIEEKEDKMTMGEKSKQNAATTGKKDITEISTKGEQRSQDKGTKPKSTREKQIKSILKPTVKTDHESDKLWQESEKTEDRKRREKLFKEALRQRYLNRQQFLKKQAERSSTQRKRINLDKTENVGEVEKSDELKRRQMDQKIKVTSVEKRDEKTTVQGEKERKRSIETSTKVAQKWREKARRKRENELTKSENNILNTDGKELSNKDINTKNDRENIGTKNENERGEEAEKSKHIHRKDTEKWPGVKDLDPGKGLQSSAGVYSGVEADWGETKKSLSKIGVEVGEDKLQNPSEFIAIMNMLLGLKRTAESFKASSYSVISDANDNMAETENQENIPKQICEKTSTETSGKTLNVCDVCGGGGGSLKPTDNKGSGGNTRDHGDCNGRQNDTDVKTNRTSEKVGDTKGQFGKRIKRIRKDFSIGGRKRSSSEGNLDRVGESGEEKGTRPERSFSVDDVSGHARTKDLNSVDGGKWQTSVFKGIWARIKLKKLKNEYVQDQNLDEKPKTNLKEGKKRDVKEFESKPTLLTISEECKLQTKEQPVKTESDSGNNSIVDEVSLDTVLANNQGKRERESETFLEKNSEVGVMNEVKNAKRVSQVSQVEKTSELEKSSDFEKVNQVKKVNHVEKGSLVGKTDKIEEADQTEEDRQVEKANRIEKASQVEKANRIEKASQAEKVDRIEKTSQVEKVSQVEKANQIEKASQVEKANQIEKASQVKELSNQNEIIHVDKAIQSEISVRKKKSKRQRKPKRESQNRVTDVKKPQGIMTIAIPELLSDTSLFFKAMSSLPGHEMCTLPALQP